MSDMPNKSLTMTQRVRENRLRMWADKQGYRLLRSRARYPRDLTFGGYQLIDVENGNCVLGWGNANRGYAATLDEVEEFLTRTKPKRANGAAAMR